MHHRDKIWRLGLFLEPSTEQLFTRGRTDHFRNILADREFSADCYLLLPIPRRRVADFPKVTLTFHSTNCIHTCSRKIV